MRICVHPPGCPPARLGLDDAGPPDAARWETDLATEQRWGDSRDEADPPARMSTTAPSADSRPYVPSGTPASPPSRMELPGCPAGLPSTAYPEHAAGSLDEMGSCPDGMGSLDETPEAAAVDDYGLEAVGGGDGGDGGGGLGEGGGGEGGDGGGE